MAAFAAALIANSASAETLRMGGVGASTAMLPPLFAAFDPRGEHQLELIPALGSSGGLRAAADGMLDIAVSGRALKVDEKATGGGTDAAFAALRTKGAVVEGMGLSGLDRKSVV